MPTVPINEHKEYAFWAYESYINNDGTEQEIYEL